MLKHAKKSKAKVIIVATEVGLIYRLQKENPDKEFYSLGTAKTCVNMKKISLATLCESLEKEIYEVNIEEDIATKAKRALEEMVKYI
jgi:quinolinate synthase